MSDEATVAVYQARVADYVRMVGPPDADIRAFAEALGPGGRALDLGCGPGTAAARMVALGLELEAWDATPAMVETARAAGVDARVALFEDLDAEGAFDGIWASFSLLHAPKADLPGLLARVGRALRPGGTLYLGMKTGTGERRDGLGRFYAFWTVEELTRLLAGAGMTVTAIREGEEAGLAGSVDPFAILWARRDA